MTVSVEEYLRTSYPDGDREYVDGEIEERNIGEIEHGDLQTAIAIYLRTRYESFWTGIAVRMEVNPTRFRVPDLTLITGPKPHGKIIQQPPFLVIEILSPEDRAARLMERIDDYLQFGVRYVWVVNPEGRRAYIYTKAGMQEAKDGILRTSNPDVLVPLAEL